MGVFCVSRPPSNFRQKDISRAIRAAALGIDPGDLSGAENPDAVGEIRRLVADQVSPKEYRVV
jgi:acetyl-CoA synthetase